MISRHNTDWESVGNFILFGAMVFFGSMIVGAIGGLLVLSVK